MSETFWLVVTCVCVAWYTALTIYVGIRGLPELIQLTRTLRGGTQAAAPQGGEEPRR